MFAIRRSTHSSVGTGIADFRTLTGGFSYYLIPGSTLGRMTV